MRSYLGLRSIRALLRAPRARLTAALVAVGYACLSLVVGLMLQFGPTGAPLAVHAVAQAPASDWWDYPALIVTAPGWVLFLPFFATATMVLVSTGVGLASGASLVVLGARLRQRREDVAPGGAGAGVVPAVAGLATLGACCCTACTATLSVGVIAAVSGTDFYTLLANNWYLDVFQLAVMGLSLVVLERGLQRGRAACPAPPRMDARFWAGAALRLSLLLAGITWSLAMFVEWSEVSPWTAPPSLWYHWVFEHQLLSIVAVLAALFPAESLRAASRFGSTMTARVVRAALLVNAFTLGVWVPPALTSAGLGGFLNELFGVLGLPVSWGAIPLDSVVGAPLMFHWGFQHLLLAAFAMVLVIRPAWALVPLGWTVGLRGVAQATAAES